MPDDDDATGRDFVAAAWAATSNDEIEKAKLRAMFRTMPRAQLELLRDAFTMDRAEMRDEAGRAFCDRRLAVLEELLA